ncbi:hemolysin family protein [Pseudactinotalea terrae]|uniref:hemolysin family protein n=1 Tax=Pseudactinotalea terrae TaxID=1743262 RepID=UPI0012E0F29A|nr:hemolysin family protein [Pseudactinotalea terrae]
MSIGAGLLIAVLLLAANAFFVGAEFAIMSARRSQIEPLAEEGVRGAKTVLWAMEHVSLMLACAQLGITVCSTGLGVVAEPALARLVEAPLIAVGAPAEAAHVVGFTLALAIVVYLHVVLGEMVPKNLAVATPERAALWFGPPLVWISRVASPVIRLLNWIANVVLRMLGVEPKDEVASAFTAEEVASIVERSRAEGVLEDEVGVISGAIEFSEATAGTVMVGLEGLTTVGVGATPEEVEQAVTRTGYSRFPVVSDEGTPLGYLHVKDVLYATTPELRAAPVPSWRIRPMSMVTPGDEVESVLASMQAKGVHVALVSAEGGPATGVVFLEDILEELVGEVRDLMQRGQQSPRR